MAADSGGEDDVGDNDSVLVAVNRLCQQQLCSAFASELLHQINVLKMLNYAAFDQRVLRSISAIVRVFTVIQPFQESSSYSSNICSHVNRSVKVLCFSDGWTIKQLATYQ